MTSTSANAQFETIRGFYTPSKHAFFGRQGGVSTQGCASLNASYAAADSAHNVEKNRKIALRSLSPSLTKLAILKQVHSATAVTINKETADTLPLPPDLEGDGLATDQEGVALGVLTADCAPILFAGKKADGAHVIGAAHAGWGGALKGISAATINAMLALGAEIETIHAAIGPCIAQESYEVDINFQAPFLNDDPISAKFFKPHPDHSDKAFFDLRGYNAYMLERAGIHKDHIFNLPHNTYAAPDRYFSHRRATHENTAQTEGRQISIICL